MNRYKKVPIFALSVSVIITSVCYGAWIFPTFNQRKDDIITKPSTPVCYIAGASNIKYMEVEAALKEANKTATDQDKKIVVVIPSINETDKTIPNTMIRDIDGDGKVTIGPNVSLTIACTENDAITGQYAHTEESNSSSNHRFADSQTDYNLYIKNNIGLSQNTTLEIQNKGSLNIGGYTGIGSGNQTPTGHTIKDFSQLTMYENSKINCYGDINCYGYIKESNSNNNSRIETQNGGSLHLPFVIYDFRGGTYSELATKNRQGIKIFPFNIYDFPNIQTEINLVYGANLYGYVTVNTSLGFSYKKANAIGNEGLFKLGGNSEVSWKYQSPSYKYSHVYDLDRGNNNISKTKVKVKKGSLTVSNIEMEVYLTIKTIEYYLPISYKYDIEIENGGQLIVDSMVKFLSGSSLNIKQGGKAVFNKNVAFYQSYVDQCVTGIKGTAIYPQNLGAAKLINDGTLELNANFSGFIDNNTHTNGFIKTGSNYKSSNTNYELITTNGDATFNNKIVTNYGYSYISNTDGSDRAYRQFVAGKSYSVKVYNDSFFWHGDSSGTTNVTETITDNPTKLTCILSTALVLMADLSYKQAGLIRTGDKVMSFNHETGKLEPNVIIINDDIDKEAQLYNVVHSEFENKKSTDFVYEHGYFDVTLNKYVYLHEHDINEYIGHEFVFIENGKITTSKLIRFSIKKKYTTLCSPVTANHLNIIADDMLSVGGGLSGLFNIFEYDRDTLAFNKEKMQEDLNKYGLLDYSYFEKYFPRELYDLLPCKYMGIAIGKGLITWNIIEEYISKWHDQLIENVD